MKPPDRAQAAVNKIDQDRDKTLMKKGRIGHVTADSSRDSGVRINARRVNFKWQRGFKIGWCNTYTYTCIHMHLHTLRHTYTYTYIHMHLHTFYTYIHMYLLTHTYTYIHIYTLTPTYTYTGPYLSSSVRARRCLRFNSGIFSIILE